MKITLQKQWKEIIATYWEENKPSSIIVEITKQQLEFIIHWDLKEVTPRLKELYKLNK